MDTATRTGATAAAVAEAIRAARETPNSIALATGIPRTTLNRRLMGASPFNVSELDAIARVLGIDASDFLQKDAA